jgi:hypothetical protein
MTRPISRLFAVTLILQMFIASMTNKTAISLSVSRSASISVQDFMLFLHCHSLVHKGVLQVPGLGWEQNTHLYFIKFYIFLTVHLRIILVSDQLDVQFLL